MAMRTDHRPWPVPSKPWIMKQNWNKVLFAHWPMDAGILEPLIPRGLKLDVFEGRAWIGIVPFYMDGIRGRGLPPIPFLSEFPELNVRTYVTAGGKPGVYFFSLDAANRMAVKAAKWFYRLPYYFAEISVKQEDTKIIYSCDRADAGGNCRFDGIYWPVSPQYIAEQGTLDYWLTERYCLYTEHRNRLFRCDIVHEPWQLQQAEAVIHHNTMIDLNGITLPESKPLLHYSERAEVFTWWLEEV
ncbi:YqjF family protein [Paenibacillus tarimensis]